MIYLADAVYRVPHYRVTLYVVYMTLYICIYTLCRKGQGPLYKVCIYVYILCRNGRSWGNRVSGHFCRFVTAVRTLRLVRPVRSAMAVLGTPLFRCRTPALCGTVEHNEQVLHNPLKPSAARRHRHRQDLHHGPPHRPRGPPHLGVESQ